jgi:hypothetical protein
MGLIVLLYVCYFWHFSSYVMEMLRRAFNYKSWKIVNEVGET